MNRDSRLRHSANATFQTVAGEAIVIHLQTGAYYSLNEVGTVFWEMLDGTKSLGDCAEQVRREYDAPLEQVEADLLEIAGELANEGLVEEGALVTRLRNIFMALAALPGLLLDSRQRRLFAEMRAFCRRLPAALSAPLPQAMASFTPPATDLSLPTTQTRRLADVAALLERRSPLGVCLRRSLTRYHYLRRAGLPVVVQFGARFERGKPDREIAGHAWLTLDGQPYFEDGENFRGFTVMLSYPPI